jgi:hypothetical protein
MCGPTHHSTEPAQKAAQAAHFHVPRSCPPKQRKPKIKNVKRGLYKALADMPNSGELSSAPYNGVDADAAERAPTQVQQTLGRYFGQPQKHELSTSLAGGHDVERLVRASSLARLATLPRSCGRCWPWNRPSANSPHFGGDTQLEPRWAHKD